MSIVTVIARFLASRGAVWLALYLPAVPFLEEFLVNEHYYAELMYLSGLYCIQLLLLTLCVTPLRRIFPRLGSGPQAFLLPVLRWLLRFRRQLGIATFVYALIHTAIYIQYNTSLVDILAEALDFKLMVGWISIGVMAILAITSNDGSVKRLGGRWQRLHSAVHPVSVLVFVHWFLFDLLGYTIYMLAGILIIMQAIRVSLGLRRT